MDPAEQERDIPYGEDWQSVAEVTAWAEASDRKRPWRSQIRDFIAEQVATLRRDAQVLELGSGPGFLAERVLQLCTQLGGYTLLDFSDPLLAISRERLARFAGASFVRADFKLDQWVHAVGGQFDCVVSMQAIHEVRHKRHVPRLYRQIYQVTAASGLVLICDHTPFDDSQRSISLYMTEQEQIGALSAGGFADVRIALSINGLVLYAGKKAG